MKNLGDKIAANPIVHAVGKATGCVDPVTNDLRVDSGCAERRYLLNQGQYIQAFYTFFRANNKQENQETMEVKPQMQEPVKMQYAVIFGVEAGDAEIALKMVRDGGGKVIAINPAPQPRPQQQQPQQGQPQQGQDKGK